MMDIDFLLPKKTRPKLNIKSGVIEMTHGSGGRAMAELIHQIFYQAFNNEWLQQRNDAALLTLPQGKVVMATDAHVISPLFFEGGDIGSLSVYGTVNDLAMLGAKPLYLSVSFILTEGFPLQDLQKIAISMGNAAKNVGAAIVTGDTKVVERDKGDGVFITVSGIGVVDENIHLSGSNAKPGDHILVSGTMGDHGVAIMAHRHQLQFQTSIQSDSAPLHDLVKEMLQVSPNLHCLRDPTRGGLATTLNELASQSEVGFIIDESRIPIQTEVASFCELLGLDPLYVANEGKLVAICAPQDSAQLLQAMRAHPLGAHAEIIGEVIADDRHFVQLNTVVGGRRIIDWLVGEQLPRIC